MLLTKVLTPLKNAFDEMNGNDLIADLPTMDTDKGTQYLRRLAGIASEAVNGYLAQFPQEVIAEKADQIRNLADGGKLRAEYDTVFQSYSEDDFKKEVSGYFDVAKDEMNAYLFAYALKKLPDMVDEKTMSEALCKAVDLMPQDNLQQRAKKAFANVAAPLYIANKVKNFYKDIRQMSMPEAASFVQKTAQQASQDLPEKYAGSIYMNVKNATYAMIDQYEAGIIEENALLELATISAKHLEIFAYPDQHPNLEAFDDTYMTHAKSLVAALNPEKPAANDDMSTMTANRQVSVAKEASPEQNNTPTQKNKSTASAAFSVLKRRLSK